MKKIYASFAFLFVLVLFSGCQQPGSTDDNTAAGEGNTAEQTAQKLELYNKVVNTSWKEREYSGNIIKSVSFAADSITIDEHQYSFNSATDLYFESEITEPLLKETDCALFIKLAEKFYGLKRYLFQQNSSGNYYEELMIYFVYNNDKWNDLFDLVSSTNPGSGSGTEASAVTGTYTFSGAAGSQVNGSFTLAADGTWSYSGKKTDMAAKKGTYTVSGNKVTVKWTLAGTGEVSETFTVTANGSSATWTLDGTQNSTFFNMLFGVSKTTEMTFTKE